MLDQKQGAKTFLQCYVNLMMDIFNIEFRVFQCEDNFQEIRQNTDLKK